MLTSEKWAAFCEGLAGLRWLRLSWFVVRCCALLGLLVHFAFQTYSWFSHHSWQHIASSFLFGTFALGLLLLLGAIIARIENSLWHLPTLMFLLLVATCALGFAALALGLLENA